MENGCLTIISAPEGKHQESIRIALEGILAYRHKDSKFEFTRKHQSVEYHKLVRPGFQIHLEVEMADSGPGHLSLAISFLNEIASIDILVDLVRIQTSAQVPVQLTNSMEFLTVADSDSQSLKGAREFMRRAFLTFKAEFTDQTVFCAPEETEAELEKLGILKLEEISNEEFQSGWEENFAFAQPPSVVGRLLGGVKKKFCALFRRPE